MSTDTEATLLLDIVDALESVGRLCARKPVVEDVSSSLHLAYGAMANARDRQWRHLQAALELRDSGK